MKPSTQSEIDAWNAGAAQADAHWADDPQPAIEFFGGRVGRTGSTHENPNAVYQRALDTHTIDRGGEK